MITIFLTWTWLLVYGIVPITMSLSLFLQIRTTGNPSPSRINPLPTLLRRLVFVQGTVMLLFGIGLFIFPATFIPFWIWQLSALTGRAIAAWLIGYGILALQLAWEDEQSRSDFAFLSYFIFSTLQLLTLLRYSSTVDWGTIGLWLYLAFLVSMIVVGAWGWQVGRKARQAS